jgi:hypothetical protein
VEGVGEEKDEGEGIGGGGAGARRRAFPARVGGKKRVVVEADGCLSGFKREGD